MDAVDIRALDHPTQLEQVVNLEIEVWGLSPRDAVPSSLLHVLAVQGGLVLGAFVASNLVGTALAFPIRRGPRWLLWSHMVAVHPHYQGQGIGFALKCAQREWALRHQYTQIAWTFDPLQRGNAKFNLHQLGAVARVYHENFYGEMTDSLNSGLPSDRLEVVWNLNEQRVKRRVSGGISLPSSPVDLVSISPGIIMQAASDGSPVLRQEWPENVPNYYAEIPPSLGQLRMRNLELALKWRLALRHALTRAFQHGFYAYDFVYCDGRWWYVLAQEPRWFLYVVECADGSLYTGITTAPQRRVARHNLGRGAAYTASRRPVKLVGLWQYSDKSAALKAESAYKRLRRDSKWQIVERRLPFQGVPFVQFD